MGSQSLWERTHSNPLIGYFWSAVSVAAATAFISLARPFDKGQASLLYLPVVIVCAMRFGFGPSIFAALLSFLCWDWFFLPPYQTFRIDNPRDWISLGVFLIAALITGRLAVQARDQTRAAQSRLQETSTLFQASEAMSHEVSAQQALIALASQLQTLCDTRGLLFFQPIDDGKSLTPATDLYPVAIDIDNAVEKLAYASFEHDRTIGIGEVPRLWAKAMTDSSIPDAKVDPRDVGVYVPLHAADKIVGVLHVAPRRDGKPFTSIQERLILTLANHAAAVIARETLSKQAAQAAALKEADALKDTLLSLVSHELRTPLAAIKASASGLLQEGSTWDEAAHREALESIDSEADRLTAIVSNLLDLSRLEAGAWKPARDWCDLADVVDTALQRMSIEEAARVRVSVEKSVPLMRIDYAQMALVVENLLRNAVKYTPAGTPIDLSIACEFNGIDETPKGIVLTVRDYGEGIAPDEIEQIFTRFYRSPRHQGGSTHGTGIGLALCKAVVTAHGGSIEARNAKPSERPGAIFAVHLPLA